MSHVTHRCIGSLGMRVAMRFWVCYTTQSFEWHDSSIHVTWLIHMCDMTDSFVWHDSFIRVKWLNHWCDTTHLWEWHDLFIWMHDALLATWTNSKIESECVWERERVCVHVFVSERERERETLREWENSKERETEPKREIRERLL